MAEWMEDPTTKLSYQLFADSFTDFLDTLELSYRVRRQTLAVNVSKSSYCFFLGGLQRTAMPYGLQLE